ncbi:MAG: hypothetical protein M1816_000654 [Peltula sp. TS41687]|nr:MAG: hypothetical protein M1816_000654 [Peltula sp. TS41687]
MLPAFMAAKALAEPTMPLKATWERIPAQKVLPRSSHTLSIINGRAYVFGGEVRPRESVDNTMHVYVLPSSSVQKADYDTIPARPLLKETDVVPEARLGHTAAVIGSRIYMFAGRSGKDMKAIEERGRVWVFLSKEAKWGYLDPMPETPFPCARSYHASASSEQPLPSARDSLVHPNTADNFAGPPATLEEHGTLFVHAGCDSSGGRLGDVWAFDVAARIWTRLPDAPGPGCGGTCLTFARDKLYRFGGFDGTNELGGQLDFLDISISILSVKDGKSEEQLLPRTGIWQTLVIPENKTGPGPRSVAGLHLVTTGQGRHYLLLFMGERSPSSSGHQTAGKFLRDVWSFQLKAEGLTGASIKDATRKAVDVATGEETWAEAQVAAADDTQAGQIPEERGWFASASMDIDPSQVVVWGGVDPENNRLGEGWILSVQ